ncbi:MAG: hypothetical protein J6V22_00330 [Clostridia bacterium]|nr:hypothetical protein [Clostridia bacterium]
MSMNDNKRDILLSALMAADAMITSVAGAQFVQQVAPKVIKNGLDTEKLKKASIGVGMGSCAGFLLASDFIPTLAQLIDRAWTKKAPVIAEAVEEVLPEVVEEPAVETVAPVVQEAENEEDDEDESFGFSTAGLEFFDAVENPEKYAELQAQEKEGLIKIVTRYRRSFASRLVQSQGDVQEYYSVIKNKLLSYKGVKGRISWGNESFNKGRSYIAKVSAKSKTLYLYLALDPATLENDTYSFEDVSAKKKYENVPVLVKIKGPRKLKYALELIEKICDQNLSLPAVKDFEEENYALPYQSTEELVKLGLVKKMVAGMPVAAFDTTVAPSETDVDVTLA